MIAAGAGVLLVLSLWAGPFSWPGALETDRRAIAGLPEGQRLPAIERFVAVYGVGEATPLLLTLLDDREATVRLYAGRLLARAGAPAAGVAATAWIMTPRVPMVDRAFGLDVLGQAAALSPTARAAVEQAARDPEPAIRMRALETLEHHPLAPSLPVVLAALGDDNQEVRGRAVRLAGATGDPRAVPPLLERLEDPGREARLQTISALGRLRDVRAAPALVRLTREGTSDERTAAIDALGALEATAATPMLIALVRRRGDDLGRHAALALGAIATPTAIEALVAGLRIPPVPDEVRLGLRAAGAAAVGALAGEIDHGTPSSAALAATLLGEIGDRRATSALCAAIDRATAGVSTSSAALEALARLADPAEIPTLVRAAESPEVEVRRGAFGALLSIADRRSVVVLEAGLADPDSGVRTLAARLAARIDEASSHLVTPVLAALLRSEAPPRDEAETAALGDALERLATRTDVEPLARAFGTAGGGARAAVARGLAAAQGDRGLSDRGLVDQLIAALGEGGSTALAVADVLAVARVPGGAVSALARAFGDAEPMVRARLCPAIANTPEGGAWLAALLAAPDEAAEVRAAAAWAARGLAAARAALELAARGGDGAVAANARAALAIGGRGGTVWAAVRLRAPDDAPLIGRWVTIRSGDGVAVQAVTDSLGVARVTGLPAGRLDLAAAGLTLRDGP